MVIQRFVSLELSPLAAAPSRYIVQMTVHWWLSFLLSWEENAKDALINFSLFTLQIEDALIMQQYIANTTKTMVSSFIYKQFFMLTDWFIMNVQKENCVLIFIRLIA